MRGWEIRTTMNLCWVVVVIDRNTRTVRQSIESVNLPGASTMRASPLPPLSPPPQPASKQASSTDSLRRRLQVACPSRIHPQGRTTAASCGCACHVGIESWRCWLGESSACHAGPSESERPLGIRPSIIHIPSSSFAASTPPALVFISWVQPPPTPNPNNSIDSCISIDRMR